MEKQPKEEMNIPVKIGNISKVGNYPLAHVASLNKPNNFARENAVMELDLLPGESRGYWKYHAPTKWFRQAKASGKVNNDHANLLFDTGAEISILDIAFARKVGCQIDESERQECIGIGESVYTTEGRTRIKITLNGNLVYIFKVWVGPMVGQDAILGMDFMVPAGIRLDLADGTLCLPDEVRVQLTGRRTLYNARVSDVKLGRYVQISVGGCTEVPLKRSTSEQWKLWVTRGERWVTTLIEGIGRRQILKITNVSPRPLTLHEDTKIGMWLTKDQVPRTPGFVSVGSRRYSEWLNLAYESTTDQVDHHVDPTEEEEGPLVEKPEYKTPSHILQRPAAPAPMMTMTHHPVPDREEQPCEERVDWQEGTAQERSVSKEDLHEVTTTKEKEAKLADLLQADDQVCSFESGELWAEDIKQGWAVIPEVNPSSQGIALEDIQIPDENTPEEVDRLRQIIWKKRHLLMGKGNALPPAARGAICDIDVGIARPIAQRVRKVAPQFREKLADLIKGLLSAKIIQPSTSPWASPIVIIVKKNGVDIRLCIDYRLVNDLTQLMVYPMPLINELLENLDGALWYCSLDMASGFWVVSMTERARQISAFVTPLGLFEWLRMPFGLKNAPQIYQRLLDNALYGFLRISPGTAPEENEDLFAVGEPDAESGPSILGRRSYIDDILVPAESWDLLCQKVERLLDVCDYWNLSVSAVKSTWGCRKVEYLGHRVSKEGLEAHPKDLQSLVDLPLPTTLKAMQSFLGSLNYYSRYIEDYAVYASILYELREVDFHAWRCKLKANDEAAAQDDDEEKWSKVQVAFAMLKNKIATAPILRHFDPAREAVIIVYASEWAISASLVQNYDGLYMPVMFTSRTLKSNELNYSTVEKEVLALLRILETCFTMLVTRPLKVLTRHSTLAWLVKSSGLQGRLEN